MWAVYLETFVWLEALILRSQSGGKVQKHQHFALSQKVANLVGICNLRI